MKNLNNIRSLIMVMFFMCLLPSYLQAQGIRIDQGTSMVVSGDAKLVLQDASFINNGNFMAGNSTVSFTSLSAKTYAIIGGTALLNFNNLIINRPFNQVQLQNDIAVHGLLGMQGGNLELNRYNLDLGKSGNIAGESIQSQITGTNGGTITAIALLNAPRAMNPGNMGAIISSTANLGNTVVIRGHVQQTNARGQSGINRYYDIRPAFNSAGNFSLRFHYLEPELANHNELDLVIWSSNDAGVSWTAAGKEANDVSNNWIAKSNLNALNRFTLGKSDGIGLSSAKGSLISKRNAGHQIFMQAYPNPAHDRFTLAVSSDKDSESIVVLQDQFGRTLERKQLNLRAGFNTVQWNIGKYASGTYYVVFENSQLANVKVVKQ